MRMLPLLALLGCSPGLKIEDLGVTIGAVGAYVDDELVVGESEELEALVEYVGEPFDPVVEWAIGMDDVATGTEWTFTAEEAGPFSILASVNAIVRGGASVTARDAVEMRVRDEVPDGVDLEVYGPDEGVPDFPIGVVVPDGDRLLLGMPSVGLVAFEGGAGVAVAGAASKEVTALALPGDEVVVALRHEDPDQVEPVGLRLDADLKKVGELDAGLGVVSALAASPDGDLWIGARNGLFVGAATDATRTEIAWIGFDDAGAAWIGDVDGLSSWSAEGGLARGDLLVPFPNRTSQDVADVALDGDVAWVVGGEQAVARVDLVTGEVAAMPAVPGPRAVAVLDGVVYVGTAEEGLWAVDPAASTAERVGEAWFPGRRIGDVAVVDGVLWVGTDDGLVRYAP